MTEKNRISSLFEKLYSGQPWIDITIVDTLSQISASQAAQKIGNCHSIWEIVMHMINWRQNVLKRLKGETILSPENNYFAPITNQTDKNWEQTLQQLDHSQTQWMLFLQDYETQWLDKKYPTNNLTQYEYIQGILQHDCYHLGQIVLLTKWLS